MIEILRQYPKQCKYKRMLRRVTTRLEGSNRAQGISSGKSSASLSVRLHERSFHVQVTFFQSDGILRLIISPVRDQLSSNPTIDV